MSKYELPIYGVDDEIVKTYKTDIVPWAIFVQAADIQDGIQKKSAKEQITEIGEVLKSVFKGLSNEELAQADGYDVMNTFKQIVSGGQKLSGGNSTEKNT